MSRTTLPRWMSRARRWAGAPRGSGAGERIRTVDIHLGQAAEGGAPGEATGPSCAGLPCRGGCRAHGGGRARLEALERVNGFEPSTSTLAKPPKAARPAKQPGHHEPDHLAEVDVARTAVGGRASRLWSG